MDFDESSDKLVTQEFLAVVLAGFGNELVPLTSDHGDDPCPKALLPIANKPMLDYPLAWLESSGVRDVLLICPAPHRTAISHHIHSDSSVSSFPSLRIDLQTYDETQDLSVGTCTILRHFASRIKQDFIILPCDFIPSPSFPLVDILNKFRTEVTYDGAIATACFFESRRPEKGSSVEEWGLTPTPVPIVWDDKSGTLLYIDTPDDVDKNSEELELGMGLLSRYPRSKLSANMQDAHVYVCRRHVLDILQAKPRFESIREEFIPWLCKPQYQRAKREKYGHILSPMTNIASQAVALKHSTLRGANTQKQSLHASFQSVTTEVPRSAVPSPVDDDADDGFNPSLRVGLVIHRADLGFAARANALHSYLELNRHYLAQTSYSKPTDPESRSRLDPKAQISTDSMVGHTTKVEERTSIKKSVIGKHCVIGKMVKIVGCVILDHCIIADGAKLEGCILGKNTKVGAKAELSKCVTQAGYEVGAGEMYKNEKLDVSDWTAARPSSEDEDDEDEDEDGSDAASDDDDS